MARGIFDEEEADGGKPEKRVRERVPKSEHGGPNRGHDTELTLGTGALLGIVFGLLLMCGLCFWLGYTVGHRGSAAAPDTATQPAAQTPAPDEEPLQGNGTIPKPSADAQAPLPQEPPGSDGRAPPAGDGDTNPATNQQSPAPEQASAPASSPAAAPPATPPPAATPTQPPSPVRSPFPATGNGSQGGHPNAPAALTSPASSPAVRPALPGAAGQFMVQVAAVSHNDDAGVLVNALRKRGYAASAQREPSDGLIHVRIGPFATHDEANRMCTRLLNDGYNALVQP